MRSLLCFALLLFTACTKTEPNITDVDGDGVAAELDCDDTNKDDTRLRSEGDFDCDGIPVDDDCDDRNPERLARSKDADCDGLLADINDDGIPAPGEDCDDAIHRNTDASDVDARTANDLDCDGLLADLTDPAVDEAGEDCDDAVAGEGPLAVRRATDLDCNDLTDAHQCSTDGPGPRAAAGFSVRGLSSPATLGAVDGSMPVFTSDVFVPTPGRVRSVSVEIKGLAHEIFNGSGIHLVGPGATPEQRTTVLLWRATCWPKDGETIQHWTFAEDPTLPPRIDTLGSDCNGLTFSGRQTYASAQSLEAFDNQQAMGLWSLQIDTLSGRSTRIGKLDDWALSFTLYPDGDCDGLPRDADCNDADPSVTTGPTSVDDADCDGKTSPANDCAPWNPGIPHATATDDDCDGLPDKLPGSGLVAGEDCHPEHGSLEVRMANDLDCDGDPAVAANPGDPRDCDDSDPSVGLSADDRDCDGVVNTEDCGPDNAAIVRSNVGDADCDGVKARLTSLWIVSGEDCNDDPSANGAAFGDVRFDTDCDGTLNGDDCDPNNDDAAFTANDQDCDGAPTPADPSTIRDHEDCDDDDDTRGLKSLDQDCDGATTLTDCDDDDATSATHATDLDCDGSTDPEASDAVCTDDLDCDEITDDLDCDPSNRYRGAPSPQPFSWVSTGPQALPRDGGWARFPAAPQPVDASAPLTPIVALDRMIVDATLTSPNDHSNLGIFASDSRAGISGPYPASPWDGRIFGVEADGNDPTQFAGMDAYGGQVGMRWFLRERDLEARVWRVRVEGSVLADEDCDDLLAGLHVGSDCNDTDDTVGRRTADDWDCDGIALASDCDPLRPSDGFAAAGEKAGDADCDGIPDLEQCPSGAVKTTAADARVRIMRGSRDHTDTGDPLSVPVTSPPTKARDEVESELTLPLPPAAAGSSRPSIRHVRVWVRFANARLDPVTVHLRAPDGTRVWLMGPRANPDTGARSPYLQSPLAHDGNPPSHFFDPRRHITFDDTVGSAAVPLSEKNVGHTPVFQAAGSLAALDAVDADSQAMKDGAWTLVLSAIHSSVRLEAWGLDFEYVFHPVVDPNCEE